MVLAGKDNYGEPPDPVELRKAAFWEKTVQQPKSEAQLRVFLDECLRGTNDIVRSFFLEGFHRKSCRTNTILRLLIDFTRNQ
jgi:hypothetical protein